MLGLAFSVPLYCTLFTTSCPPLDLPKEGEIIPSIPPFPMRCLSSQTWLPVSDDKLDHYTVTYSSLLSYTLLSILEQVHPESVCVFHPAERPSTIFSLHSDGSRGSETASSDNNNDGRTGPQHRPCHSVVAAAEPPLVPLKVADVILQIPSLRILSTCFVHLESVTPHTIRTAAPPTPWCYTWGQRHLIETSRGVLYT